jgi:hypothetical protein
VTGEEAGRVGFDGPKMAAHYWGRCRSEVKRAATAQDRDVLVRRRGEEQ